MGVSRTAEYAMHGEAMHREPIDGYPRQEDVIGGDSGIRGHRPPQSQATTCHNHGGGARGAVAPRCSPRGPACLCSHAVLPSWGIPVRLGGHYLLTSPYLWLEIYRVRDCTS
jgi:hypothetical protein